MSKILLVDGNSLLFRAYYATAYSGNIMSTSNGVYTNAIYGFSHMLNKALETIDPEYVLVAFDKGKHTFRHEMYDGYKSGRRETPDELVPQFALVREMMNAYNIKYLERDDIEADDIIGCAANAFSKDNDVLILSSDNDLLQLVNDRVKVALMIKGVSEMAIMDAKGVYDKFSLSPKQIIDYKGLSGDKSDNIKGVAGIGDKGAVKLLTEYETIEGIYENIEQIKGKLKEKLIDGKQDAFNSKKLATIITDVDLGIDISEIKYDLNINTLRQFINKYEMRSLTSQVNRLVKSPVTEASALAGSYVEAFDPKLYKDDCAVYFEHDDFDYYDPRIYAVGLSDDKTCQVMEFEKAIKNADFINYLKGDHKKVTFNLKQVLHLLDRHEIKLNNFEDIMLMGFISNNYLADMNAIFYEYGFSNVEEAKTIYGTSAKPLSPESSVLVARTSMITNALALIYPKLNKKLIDEQLIDYYRNIELPLSRILQGMEKQGINVDSKVLDDISDDLNRRLLDLSYKIYEYAGHEFNINSPKQLATVLFEEIGLPKNRKNSTNIETLEKLRRYHPIIDAIIDYRSLAKIVSTYSEGLKKYIKDDGKIHTIYTQTITQTGRLSSVEPNLQNISVRNDEGREVRKAFVASEDSVLLSTDYSNIELRVLAALSGEEKLIDLFNHNIDVHSSTASSIFNIPLEEVTSDIRRKAKAINFGIIYGISDFGLAKQADISLMEAKQYIENYFRTYPKVKKFLDDQIAFLQENKYVKTITNRKRYIKEIDDENYSVREFAKRAAMNTPVQGSAADIMKAAMIRIDRLFKENNIRSKMILQIHDELIFDVANDELDKVIELINDGMNNAVKIGVKLNNEIGYAKDLYGCK